MAIPAGLILLWHGLLANIPAGWVLCDGTNGTPDLRSKFVKGTAAATNPGDTGGAATHTTTAHAARTHSGAALADHAILSHSGLAAANHTVFTFIYYTDGGPIVIGNNNGTFSHTVTAENDHPAQVHSVTSGDHAARTHSAGDNVPVNYALAFIMKT